MPGTSAQKGDPVTKIIESKVAIAAAGGGVGGVLATFLLWLLGVTLWHVSASAGSADLAIAAVPAPVSAVLLTVLPAALSLLGGYLAPHTARTDLASPLTVALAEAQPTVVTSDPSTPAS